MRNCHLIALLLLVLLCAGGAMADPGPGRITGQIDVSSGIRIDEFDWTIAGDFAGGSPNILSELVWDDLRSLQMQLDGRLEYDRQGKGWAPLLKGRLAAGRIVAGDNRDSDYATDNRTREWSRSHSAADRGDTADVSLAAGLKFTSADGSIALTPLLGYAYHRVTLRMADGVQVLSDPVTHAAYFPTDPFGPAPIGPLAGLNSRFESEWWGPWLGIDLDLVYSPRLKFGAGFEYHLAEYYATANWNLRSDLQHPVSFDQDVDARGIVLRLSGEYLLKESWSLLAKGQLADWRGEGGVMRFFTTSGTTVQRLNEVNWQSYALLLGICYRF